MQSRRSSRDRREDKVRTSKPLKKKVQDLVQIYTQSPAKKAPRKEAKPDWEKG